MKGLHHQVIEIRDTENSNIEKILVFLKPHQTRIDIGTTRQEAQEILQKVKIRNRIPAFSLPPKVIVFTVTLIISIISLLFVIF